MPAATGYVTSCGRGAAGAQGCSGVRSACYALLFLEQGRSCCTATVCGLYSRGVSEPQRARVAEGWTGIWILRQTPFIVGTVTCYLVYRS